MDKCKKIINGQKENFQNNYKRSIKQEKILKPHSVKDTQMIISRAIDKNLKLET